MCLCACLFMHVCEGALHVSACVRDILFSRSQLLSPPS